MGRNVLLISIWWLFTAMYSGFVHKFFYEFLGVTPLKKLHSYTSHSPTSHFNWKRLYNSDYTIIKLLFVTHVYYIEAGYVISMIQS